MNDDRAGGILAVMGAAALGAIIGAGVALMLAPKPGAELREDIKSTATSAHQRIHEATEKVVSQLKAASEELTKQAKDAVEEVEETTEES
ncbi:MAG: YtxH domain-containing protein [Armatimonadota bacterium]